MKFYHGSMSFLDIGTILRPSPSYAENWSFTDFYAALEYHRPADKIPHRDAVFMCGSEDDVDISGGGNQWLFELRPFGQIMKHDQNWSSAICCLVGNGFSIDSPQVALAADAYWSGAPHPDEQVWEYLCLKAEILKVSRFEETLESALDCFG